jgi:erythromycin esterase
MPSHRPSPLPLIVAAILASLVACGALASPADGVAPWLRERAIPLRTIEPSAFATGAAADDADRFADLRPLAAVIGDARVVILGEQAHAEGLTFLAKVRLIEYLHIEMGFDVLCFESGVYDCDRAWRAIRAGTNATSAMRDAIFPIWTEAAEFLPLMEFVEARARSERPLELCGYDCQLSGRFASTSLAGDIASLDAQATPPALDASAHERIVFAITRLTTDGTIDEDAAESARSAIRSLASALDTPAYASVAALDRSFWKRVVASLEAQIDFVRAGADPKRSLAEQFNPRDICGGETLAWLANERFRGRKIIVWAASMHAVRRAEGITRPEGDEPYRGVRTAGCVASETLGEDLFVLSAIAGPGRAGNAFGRTWTVPAPPADSLEDRLRSMLTGPAIVPLRAAPANSFGSERFVARPLGNAPMLARWRDHVDAFLWIPTMAPASRDPLRALEVEANKYLTGITDRDSFADKGDLNGAWDAWIGARTRSPEETRFMHERVTRWIAERKGDPAQAGPLAWRLLALEARLLPEGDDRAALDRRIELLDAALAAYPSTRHRDPSRESGFHHLAADRAVAQISRDGADAAIEWLARLLRSDDRMRAFFAPAVLARLQNDRVGQVRLRSAIAEAFEARAQARPDEAAATRLAATLADATFDLPVAAGQ